MAFFRPRSGTPATRRARLRPRSPRLAPHGGEALDWSRGPSPAGPPSAGRLAAPRSASPPARARKRERRPAHGGDSRRANALRSARRCPGLVMRANVVDASHAANSSRLPERRGESAAWLGHLNSRNERDETVASRLQKLRGEVERPRPRQARSGGPECGSRSLSGAGQPKQSRLRCLVRRGSSSLAARAGLEGGPRRDEDAPERALAALAGASSDARRECAHRSPPRTAYGQLEQRGLRWDWGSVSGDPADSHPFVPSVKIAISGGQASRTGSPGAPIPRFTYMRERPRSYQPAE